MINRIISAMTKSGVIPLRRWTFLLLLAFALAGCARPPELPFTTPEPPAAVPAPAPAHAPAPAPAPAPTPASAHPAAPPKVLDLSWAPDSRHLALLGPDGLQVMDTSTDSFDPWRIQLDRRTKLVGWKHDGSALYLKTGENGLLEVSRTGEVRELAPPTPGLHAYEYSFHPSPGAPLLIRQWRGPVSGKFQLIGGQGAWEGYFLSWSPTGSHFAYQTAERTFHIVDADTLAETEVAEWPQWSPTGQHYLLTLADGLQVHSLTGEAVISLPAGYGSVWSADGSRLVSPEKDGLWTLGADGQNRQLLRSGDLAGVQEMVWLAQDEILYFIVGTTGGGGTAFYPYLITGGQIQLLPSGFNGIRPKLYVSPDRRRVAYVVGPPVDDFAGELVLYP